MSDDAPLVPPNPSDLANAVIPDRDPFDDSDLELTDEGKARLKAMLPKKLTDNDVTGDTPRPFAARHTKPSAPDRQRDAQRQRWACVNEDGFRVKSMAPDGEIREHPIFQDDSHLMGQYVRCPICHNPRVIRVDAETLATV